MPATEQRKKTSKKPAAVDPEIIKARRETVEKRILRLEEKLNKDRALLLKYVAPDEAPKEEEPLEDEPV
jgi:hypothetical protein